MLLRLPFSRLFCCGCFRRLPVNSLMSLDKQQFSGLTQLETMYVTCIPHGGVWTVSYIYSELWSNPLSWLPSGIFNGLTQISSIGYVSSICAHEDLYLTCVCSQNDWRVGVRSSAASVGSLLCQSTARELVGWLFLLLRLRAKVQLVS